MLLKELLKSKGVKQNWLASRLGVSEVTVSNWVKEKSVPSLHIPVILTTQFQFKVTI